MAHVYVRSGAAGAGTGADWANAYTTLAAALTAKAAGDQFWVSEDHSEAQGSAMTLTSPGTVSNPCTIIGVNHAGSVPPVDADILTTPTIPIKTTGNFAQTLDGCARAEGLILNAGSGAVAAGFTVGGAAAGMFWHFKNCEIGKAGTSSSTSAIQFGQGGVNLPSKIILERTQLRFGHTGDQMRLRLVNLEWIDTPDPAIVGVVPTVLFPQQGDNRGGSIVLENVDLNAAGSGKTISTLGGGANIPLLAKHCKINSAVTFQGAPTVPGPGGFGTQAVLVGATGNINHEKYGYEGTQSVEPTIVRTGGALFGAAPYAWKIVTSANAKWMLPFSSMPMAVWNDNITGDVIVTVHGIWGGGAVPNNDEIWLDVVYLGAAASPLGSRKTTTKASLLAAAAAVPADAVSAWGGSTTKFKLIATLTAPAPAQVGFIYATVKVGKASDTFYIDPKLYLG